MPIKAHYPLHRIQLDLIDFSREPDGQYKYLLHIKDIFTKYCQVYALTSKEADEVARCVSAWISAFTASVIGQMDIRGEFMAIYKRVFEVYGVKIINSRPLTPRTQGQIERGSSITKKRSGVSTVRGLKGFVAAAHIACSQYSVTQHPVTEMTPFFAPFGHNRWKMNKDPLIGDHYRNRPIPEA